FDEAFLNMEPTYIQENDVPPNSPGSDGKPDVEPEDAFDENGRDVFDGYSYLAPREDRDSVVEEEEDEEPGEDDGARPDSLTPGTGATEGEDEDMNDSYEHANTSSSTRTASTRPTSIERDGSTELPAATHGKGRPNGLESLTENDADEDREEEEDWDVV